jgi:hypothetical protein
MVLSALPKAHMQLRLQSKASNAATPSIKQTSRSGSIAGAGKWCAQQKVRTVLVVCTRVLLISGAGND